MAALLVMTKRPVPLLIIAPNRLMTMNSSDSEYDDLTVIRGIGSVRQRWLREALGVRTIPELAALSVDELETRLKAAGQVAPRHEIERWLTQARELAGAAEPASPQVIAATEEELGGAASDLANVDEALPRGLDLENSETGKKDRSPADEDGWKPFASFVVEFQVRQLAGQAQERQTKVHYMEADKSRRLRSNRC
jgi:predicted RecB family nuclease